MSRVLIIGYGNTLRGDDGFGYRAAERLRSLIDRPGVEVIAAHQLTPELVEPLSRADSVIFIDAASHGAVGELKREAVFPSAEPAAFSHSVTPAGLLTAALCLYGRAPEAMLYSVAGEQFGYGEALSPLIEAALDRIAAIEL
jgi:hydrogenase maturation protease